MELYRIVLMLGIIAHHYVVNSGVSGMLDFGSNPFNTVYLDIFGWFGKTGINCFLLITGYFMCQQQFSWQKFLRLYLEIKFYKVIIYLVFLALGYESFSLTAVLQTVFNLAYEMNSGFLTSFMILYLFVPFINILIEKMSKRQHLSILTLLIIIQSGIAMFAKGAPFEYSLWYLTMYLIGAYLRKYPLSVLENQKVAVALLIACNFIAWLTIVMSYWLPYEKYSFVADSNKIMALATSVAMFSVFNNMKMGSNKIINTIAASTFGVFLIHANSGAMSDFLWGDLLHCKEVCSSSLDTVVIHSILSVVGVYVVCVLIDYLRRVVLEKPLFGLIENHSKEIELFFAEKTDRVMRKFKKR